MALHHKITGETNQELIAPDSRLDVTTVSLTNVHGTNACTVDLFIYSCKGTFYFLKDVNLPIGASLIHDQLRFGNDGDTSFGLYIKLTKSASETPAVDVTIY